MEVFSTLGSKIVATRKLFGLTQLELADRSHVASKTLRKVERGFFDDDIFNDTPRKVCYALYECAGKGAVDKNKVPTWLLDYISKTIPGELTQLEPVVEETCDNNAEVLNMLNDISDKLDIVVTALLAFKNRTTAPVDNMHYNPDRRIGSKQEPIRAYQVHITTSSPDLSYVSPKFDNPSGAYLWIYSTLNSLVGYGVMDQNPQILSATRLFSDAGVSSFSYTVKANDDTVYYIKMFEIPRG